MERDDGVYSFINQWEGTWSTSLPVQCWPKSPASVWKLTGHHCQPLSGWRVQPYLSRNILPDRRINNVRRSNHSVPQKWCNLSLVHDWSFVFFSDECLNFEKLELVAICVPKFWPKLMLFSLVPVLFSTWGLYLEDDICCQIPVGCKYFSLKCLIWRRHLQHIPKLMDFNKALVA